MLAMDFYGSLAVATAFCLSPMVTARPLSYHWSLNDTPSDGKATMNTPTNTAPVTEEAKLAWVAPTLDVCATGEAEVMTAAGGDSTGGS